MYANDTSLLDDCKRVSPAIKAVFEEVKQGFLHHVRHLQIKTTRQFEFCHRCSAFLGRTSSAVLSCWSRCSPRNLWGRGPPALQASWREPHRKGAHAPSVNDKSSITRLSAMHDGSPKSADLPRRFKIFSLSNRQHQHHQAANDRNGTKMASC